MAKIHTPALELIDGLREDILWLLILLYSLRQRMRLPDLGTWSREEVAIEMVFLESATRDIILRLTALDDDSKGNRSFQTVLKALCREGMQKKQAAPLELQVKDYRQKINPLKVSHRNNYIAHVTDLASVTPRISSACVDVEAAASAAVNLLEAFAGKAIGYKFRVGSQELEIDLLEALSTPQ